MSPAGAALSVLSDLAHALDRGVRVTDMHSEPTHHATYRHYWCTLQSRTASGRLTETSRGGTLPEALSQALGRLRVHEAALACSRVDETPIGEQLDGSAEVES